MTNGTLTLVFAPAVRHPITVATKDGVVKLEGKTGSWDEKNLVSKRVSDVPGVKMVFNNMTIERIAPMAN